MSDHAFRQPPEQVWNTLRARLLATHPLCGAWPEGGVTEATLRAASGELSIASTASGAPGETRCVARFTPSAIGGGFTVRVTSHEQRMSPERDDTGSQIDDSVMETLQALDPAAAQALVQHGAEDTDAQTQRYGGCTLDNIFGRPASH